MSVCLFILVSVWLTCGLFLVVRKTIRNRGITVNDVLAIPIILLFSPMIMGIVIFNWRQKNKHKKLVEW
jgi:hypothetical protein